MKLGEKQIAKMDQDKLFRSLINPTPEDKKEIQKRRDILVAALKNKDFIKKEHTIHDKS